MGAIVQVCAARSLRTNIFLIFQEIDAQFSFVNSPHPSLPPSPGESEARGHGLFGGST
jgi:hypothetical protein